MAYIGKTPVIGNFQKCDSISVVNGQAAYTLQVSGVNVSPQSENHMLVSLNGILQAPVDSFTVSGSTLTFASNLVTGDVIDFVMILGNVLDLGVPSDNTVSLAKLTATGTKDSTTFLRGDNTFGVPPLGGITEVDQWRLTTTFTGNALPITSNWERVDQTNRLQGYLGTGMTESSGVFTFPSTGFWLVGFKANYAINGDDRSINNYISVTNDNSTYRNTAQSTTMIQQTGANWTGAHNYCEAILDVNNLSNDKVRFQTAGQNSSTETQGDTDNSVTSVIFIKLGDT